MVFLVNDPIADAATCEQLLQVTKPQVDRDVVKQLAPAVEREQRRRELAVEREQLEFDVRVLGAAAESYKLLVDGWRRAPYERRDCDEYAPNRIRLDIRNWQLLYMELRSSVSGIPGSGTDRMALAHRKADLELATDQALAPILHWRTVAWIYRRQERFSLYLARRAEFGQPAAAPHEPSMKPLAEAICYERMAIYLGWTPLEKVA